MYKAVEDMHPLGLPHTYVDAHDRLPLRTVPCHLKSMSDVLVCDDETKVDAKGPKLNSRNNTTRRSEELISEEPTEHV